MGNKNMLQHELRKEFHNILGILKIIKSENLITDSEMKHMIELSLDREKKITNHFEELYGLLGNSND